MRTFFAAFALLATVNAAGGGGGTPKEKEAKVDNLRFNSTDVKEFIAVEYLQRLIADKATLIVATTVRSEEPLYDTRINVNLKVKGSAACAARYVADAAQTGQTGKGTDAQQTFAMTIREAKTAELANCDTKVNIEKLLKADITKDVAFTPVLSNVVTVDGVRLAKTTYTPYNRAVVTWIRTLAAAPKLKEGEVYQLNAAWTTGTKNYISKDLFVDFKINPIDKSATVLSWGAAAVTAAAALYL
jgi:hypothetical protein